MPKLHEVIGGTKTKIYCQGTICWKCVLAALWTVGLGLTKFGNQAKPLKYSEKNVVFHTSLEQMFKRMATNLDTQLRAMQQTDMCAQKSQVPAASVIREMRSSSESTSHCHLQRPLEWTGQTNGLASQVTIPHTNGLLPMGTH